MKNRLSPVHSIRQYCSWCCNGQREQIKLCETKDCPLYPLRFGRRKVGYSALRAIRKRCIDCKGGSKTEVKKCEFSECPLYPFRTGHNPSRRGVGGNVI